MCLYPRSVRNPKYLPNKKNGWCAPPISDKRIGYVPIGCGECMECRKKKASEWNTRLLEDIRHNKNGKFITLTFSNESIKELVELVRKDDNKLKGYDLDNAIATIAVRRFLERWRKKFKKSLRHWFVTELGHNGTENIHLHGLIWTNETVATVVERWAYGFMWPRYDWRGNYVNEETIGYITKYVSKMDKDHKYYKQIILTSSGIGAGYMNRTDWKTNKYKPGETDESYRNRAGFKSSLPIYYRNKIYTDEEKEKLWIEKLDKQERWVNGVRIDISGDVEKYYRALQWARKINKMLGYGDGSRNWDREEYERMRREMQLDKRLREK